MFDTYEEIFTARGESYNRACRAFPDAREQERRELISRLPVRPGQVICDVPAGGGYLAEGIIESHPEGTVVVCVEPSPLFARGINSDAGSVICSDLTGIALADASMDCVASLAGLHHLQDKQAFYRESMRILRPGGTLVFADVQEGSATAGFLNGPVDRFTETGHEGLFLNADIVRAGLQSHGFGVREACSVQLSWRFDRPADMVSFCHGLFGMVKATPQQVREAIYDQLEVTSSSRGTAMSWPLLYVVAQKPG